MSYGFKIPASRITIANLPKVLILLTSISTVVILVLSISIFQRVFTGFAITTAKQDSIQLCNVMVAEQRALLFESLPAGRPSQLFVHPANMHQLDQNLRLFLQPFNILKIKIYDASSRIIYSTEKPLIGKYDSRNLHLRNALKGGVDAPAGNQGTRPRHGRGAAL